MPELPDDDVDSIKEGTYVDGEDRKVRFAKCKVKVSAANLNVSDFQKGTMVHRTKDGRSEETGEVKRLEDGKLIIEVDGKTREEKAKYLMKCDFQPGMFVFWRLQDKYVPPGHVGKVLGEVDIRGKIKVAFPGGAWFFKSRDLVKALVQPGSYVQWNQSDGDIAEGEIGEATGEAEKGFPEFINPLGRSSDHRSLQERRHGTAFRDDSWNPLDNEAEVLYVDKEKPGWDCTVRKPEGWERAKDVKHVDSPCIVADGAQYTDVKQGQIGDCFFIAALAAVAANRKSFLRQALVAYDEEVGVYGVMFCEEMHFVYEIVDDLFAVDEYKRLKFAKSANAKNEFWVSIIEKAYFKHVTCLEMCDGGWGPEAVFSLVDGVAGVYPVTDKEFRDPSRLWATVNSGLENGEIMTTSFTKPSKGKYAHLGDGEDAWICRVD
eukprot:s662_g17.t1